MNRESRTTLELASALVTRLAVPLVRGGSVRLLSPIDVSAATEMARGAPGSGLFEELESLRCREARRVHPIDELDCVAAEEWFLLAALNNLLQSTNPSLLESFRGAAKVETLLEWTRALIERAGAPNTLAQVLSRHALFSRVVFLTRRDTEVTWWSGKQSFVGRRPPSRLLAWPRLRRVSRRARVVGLTSMGPEPFRQTLRRWISATPLTAFAGLRGPASFRWSGSILSLTALPLGRRWAMNLVLTSEDVPAALRELDEAAQELRAHSPEAFRHARGFVEEGLARQQEVARRS